MSSATNDGIATRDGFSGGKAVTRTANIGALLSGSIRNLAPGTRSV